jgi:probable phosphoglycerate mutase
LNRLKFANVFSSPSQRAWRTCELAGFGGVAVRDPQLVEWDYGEYEGRITADIKRERPGWQIFRDGCPGGESVADVTSRADRVVEKLRQLDGDILLFSSSHFLRALAVRWLGLDMVEGQHFILTTASISILGYDKSVDEPAMKLWNYDLTDFQTQT